MKILCTKWFDDTNALTLFIARNKIKKNDIQYITISMGRLMLLYWFNPRKKLIN